MIFRPKPLQIKGFQKDIRENFDKSMKNTGKEYETFVANLQQAILDSETFIKQKNIKIELNKKILDNCGSEREFDIYWEYELGGVTYRTIIECKDYNSAISIEKIDALVGKIRDIPSLKPIFATKIGYQKGAKKKAEQNQIDLLIVREQDNSDWEDQLGNPLIKKININLEVYTAASISNFNPIIDAKWAEENTDIDLSSPPKFSTSNKAIVIDDLDNSDRYSLCDLAHKLLYVKDKKAGVFHKEESFQNAFIYFDDVKLKLSSYSLDYKLSGPAKLPIEIDFGKELIGVIEYLNKGVKKSVFKKGIIKESKLH